MFKGSLLFLACIVILSQAVWPQPQEQTISKQTYTLDESNFFFSTNAQNNFVLSEAFIRYGKLFFIQKNPNVNPPKYNTINTLSVDVENPNDGLGPDTDESYNLTVASPTSTLKAKTVFGALRGLETFSQLVSFDTSSGNYLVIGQTIVDFPRFSFRSILVDTSRHYIPLNTILQFIDAMAYNKFNVLHWHIVDDQSFPFVSALFSQLSIKGAYPPYDSHVYTQQQVQEVIQYAYLRGIRVIPEFDTPAHATSWTKGYPQLGTQCYVNNTPVVSDYVPINPISDTTYSFLKTFFGEVASVFPDQYIHIGGDELDYGCWASNPEITDFMKKQGWGTKYNLLEQYYETKLVNIIQQLNKRYVVWEDVYDNNVVLDPNTIIAVWRGNWEKTMATVTQAGFQAILYSPWYLNYISYGDDWVTYYNVEPTNFPGTPAQKAKVIGGSATFWAEFIDATNLVSRAFIRASAVGERLWSAMDVNDANKASPRLHYFRCQMLKRNIPAEPMILFAPCTDEWQGNYQAPWEQ